MADLQLVVDAPVVITPAQVDLIKSTIAPNATDAELQLFFYDCQRRGVHPLDRLIHFTKRKGKYTPIVGIDYMRMRAATTGQCVGIDDAAFRGSPKEPAAFTATVTVWRLVAGVRCAFTASARWLEYKPDEDFIWRRMPHSQLAKCAEALALRKGFPQELHGLYATEEMDQAGGVDDPDAPAARRGTKPPTDKDPLITKAQRARLFAIADDVGVSRDQLKTMIPGGSTATLRRDAYENLIATLQESARDPGQEG